VTRAAASPARVTATNNHPSSLGRLHSARFAARHDDSLTTQTFCETMPMRGPPPPERRAHIFGRCLLTCGSSRGFERTCSNVRRRERRHRCDAYTRRTRLPASSTAACCNTLAVLRHCSPRALHTRAGQQCSTHHRALREGLIACRATLRDGHSGGLVGHNGVSMRQRRLCDGEGASAREHRSSKARRAASRLTFAAMRSGICLDVDVLVNTFQSRLHFSPDCGDAPPRQFPELARGPRLAAAPRHAPTTIASRV
jgi:hypothetical protein